ncbi:TlpA family protein disulfide reductase [Methylocystis parvus]|uniref:TlpA family protein disulfide reductase n=1 Tax=Methylocystis parvus TaxID=134 RepID=A0A6B8ME74_9HYPH|nr:TlpA disulfide reductase family protein [Methylocystis parvus]QGM98920.1 TlpA family protein disulfide reductase [Methylocystis parvus]WBK00725.1 TlpA family protein disulfide reductase [Methylocystis parvus OBBP]
MARFLKTLFALLFAVAPARAEILGMKVERMATEEEMKSSLRQIDLVDEKGQPFDLRATMGNGRPTFVSIWAHWCPNCLAEAPGYKALAKACPDRWNVVFVSSMRKDYPKDLAKFRTYGLPWKIYRIADTVNAEPDKAKAAVAFYGLTKEGGVVTPTHYLIDETGAVKAIISGKMNIAEPERLAAFCGN